MDRETLPTLEELAAFARAPSRGDGAAHYRQILERLAAHPRDSKALLEELLLSRDIDTRAWAAMAGTRVFGKEFERVLVRLLDDKTSEMQSLALGLLENLDPGALEPLLPKLRRKLLHSKDEDDVRASLSALLETPSAMRVGTERRCDHDRVLRVSGLLTAPRLPG